MVRSVRAICSFSAALAAGIQSAGPRPGTFGNKPADALKIMKESLEKAGSSMENVLKVQVALVDPEKNWEPMNEVYNTFFPKNRPARSYFGSTGFRRPGQLLQIDCIAYVD